MLAASELGWSFSGPAGTVFSSVITTDSSGSISESATGITAPGIYMLRVFGRVAGPTTGTGSNLSTATFSNLDLQVVSTPIPEPGGLLPLVGGLWMLLGRRRTAAGRYE